MTVPGLVDGGVGLELRHQVRAEGVALQFATGAPASADPAPVPGVVGVGRAQPAVRGRAVGRRAGGGVGDQP